ncbi:MAG: BrnA antitoxin family protein [Pseudomonadota bacterium]
MTRRGGLETHPTLGFGDAPKKTRITAAFDADVVRFYRALGQGYQARMNAVLRLYMLALKSKLIRGRDDPETERD